MPPPKTGAGVLAEHPVSGSPPFVVSGPLSAEGIAPSIAAAPTLTLSTATTAPPFFTGTPAACSRYFKAGQGGISGPRSTLFRNADQKNWRSGLWSGLEWSIRKGGAGLFEQVGATGTQGIDDEFAGQGDAADGAFFVGLNGVVEGVSVFWGRDVGDLP